MSVQHQLNQTLLEWDKFIPYARQKRREQDEKHSEYKHQRAKFITAYKANNPGTSQAAAETAADADDALHQLYLERLLAESETDSCKDKLVWFRSQADALRSAKVDERESARLYAENAV